MNRQAAHITALAGLTIAAIALPNATASAAGSSDGPGARRLLTLVNAERHTAGLTPLVSRNDVTDIAANFTSRTAQQRRLFHNDDYLSDASLRRLRASRVGENVAFAGSVDEAHDALMRSPHHRDNILNRAFEVAGFAVVPADDGTVYVTEDFLRPEDSADGATPQPTRAQAAAPPAHASPPTRQPAGRVQAKAKAKAMRTRRGPRGGPHHHLRHPRPR